MTTFTTLPVIEIQRKRSYPPRHSSFTQGFWSGLTQGRWQTTSCQVCQKQTFPPKPFCPHCWSPRVEWAPLSARGVLYSWTRIYAAPTAFADESPYATGIIDLDSNIRLACRLVDVPGIDLKPDMPMEMVVLQFEDGPLFAARPVANA